MLIALDHDGTYTRDPQMWHQFIDLAAAFGHEVVCVTMRYSHEEVHMACEVIYTSRKAKLPHRAALGRVPDIWIDDNPQWIFQGAT